MPFRYVMRWGRGEMESISVEAWPRNKEVALPKERRKPSFVIGSIKGGRVIMLHHLIKKITKSYGAVQRGNVLRVNFPQDDLNAIADAYRLGLAAATLANVESDESAEVVLRYVMRCSKEEIWFWASKYLSVVDDGIAVERVIKALCLIGGAYDQT